MIQLLISGQELESRATGKMDGDSQDMGRSIFCGAREIPNAGISETCRWLVRASGSTSSLSCLVTGIMISYYYY